MNACIATEIYISIYAADAPSACCSALLFLSVRDMHSIASVQDNNAL